MTFIKSFSYTLTSNVLSMLISLLVVAIVPKSLNIEEYGYFQLYLFYVSFVGLLQFGWNDGVLLRYGGEHYDTINKKVFNSQFWMLFLFQITLSAGIFLLTTIYNNNIDKSNILKFTAVSLIFTNVQGFFLYILQATYKMKNYAITVVISRISFILGVLLLFLSNNLNYKTTIIADIIGRFISLLYAIYCCREIVFRKISILYSDIVESWRNISIGIKLMIANVANLLLTGVIRYGIENHWGVSEFAKISLTISTLHLVTSLVAAVGVVLFPVLRRIDNARLPGIFQLIRSNLNFLILGLMILSYPIKVLLSIWLPDYSESLKYIALLFPMILATSRISLLINPYLTSMRKENAMLLINLFCLFLSIVLTFISIYILDNLTLAVVSMLIITLTRCIVAETYLAKQMNFSLIKDHIYELVLISFYVLIFWFLDTWYSILLYLFVYFIYLLINRSSISDSINKAKIIINDQ